MDKKKDIRRALIGAGRGYRRYTIYSTFIDFFLAFIFIAVSSPIFIFISLLIWVRCGRPILYAGTRLGERKKPFKMYKFRTLPVGMDKKIGAELVSRLKQPLPFFVKFLRETRLDELPQLFNILKRDMDFLGPRPVRLEVYQSGAERSPIMIKGLK